MYNFKKFKALLTAIITGAAAFSVQIPAASAESYELTDPDILTLFGDVNFDGSVSLSDAIQLNQYLLGNSDDMGNWRNADIAEDGTIDVFDLINLRKQLLGAKPPVGGTLNIDLADIMTGEFLEGADIAISGVVGMSSYPLGEFHYAPDDTITIHGLPTSDKYHYVLDITNLPENYGNRFGNWDHTLKIAFDEDSDTKDLTIRLLDDDQEFNIKGGCYDWTRGDADIPYGAITITDKDGNIYYQNIFSDGFALPDGEYHAEIGSIDYPVDLIDTASSFADELKELFPDVEFFDKSNGFDFTVKDGVADKNVYFDFGPKEDAGNTIGITCIDAATGDLIEGCEFTVIEAPDTYAKEIAKVISSADKPITIDDLHHAGKSAYKVIMDKLPEGYTSMTEQLVDTNLVFHNYSDIKFFLFPEEMKDELTANIYTLSGTPVTDDIGTVKIYDASTDELAAEVKVGESFILPDGVYNAKLELNEEGRKEYMTFDTDLLEDADDIAAVFWNGIFGSTSFKVQNGCPDKNISIYIADAAQSNKIANDYIKDIYNILD